MPRPRVTAAMMAFGGGALLAALTLDLVGEAMGRGHFYVLAGGCLLGCLLFIVLNQIVNERGGFLRHAASTIEYLTERKTARIRLFRALPPDVMGELLPQILIAGANPFRALRHRKNVEVDDHGETDFDAGR